MIEKILHQIIVDLGPAGILIVGIFLIQYSMTKKICKALKVLNHKSTEANELLRLLVDYKKLKELYGKVGGNSGNSF